MKPYTFVSVRVPTELINYIDELSIEAMRSRSAQIIFILNEYKNNQKINATIAASSLKGSFPETLK